MSDRRRESIDIYAPTEGIKVDTPRNIMTPRSQPTGLNCNLYYGVNQKEYGTTVFATGTGSVVGAPIYGIYELQYTNARLLQVLTNTGVYKYTSSADAFVTDGQTMTGSYGDYWSGIQYNEAFIYTNGKKAIQVKTALANTGTDMASALSPTTYNAWCVAALNDHLNLYHTFENSTEYPKRVQWSKKGALVYSAGTTDFDSGTAGAIDLQDAEGELKLAVDLGGGKAVYAENSIHVQTWIGGDEIYKFEKTVSGVGTPSRRGAVTFKDVNYFFSANNIYAYYGGDDLRPIGDAVKRSVFAELNQNAAEHVWVEYDSVQDRALFHIPTGTSTVTDVAWIYNVKDQSWSRLGRSYRCSAEFSRKTGLTIGELVGDIGAQNYTLGSLEGILGARTQLYGDDSGRVVKRDALVYSLSYSGTSVAQPWQYETPDLNGNTKKDSAGGSTVEFMTTRQRWLQTTVWMSGNGLVTVETSVDGGRNYTELPNSPIQLIPAGTTHTLSIQKRSPTCALRFTETGLNTAASIEQVKVEFFPGSDNA